MLSDKPVAWMVGKMLCRLLAQAEIQSNHQGLPIIPLYTKEDAQDDNTREKSKRQN